jgi:hypothetical protein
MDGCSISAVRVSTLPKCFIDVGAAYMRMAMVILAHGIDPCIFRLCRLIIKKRQAM